MASTKSPTYSESELPKRATGVGAFSASTRETDCHGCCASGDVVIGEDKALGMNDGSRSQNEVFLHTTGPIVF